ncbi:MAG: prolyl oligopeptidase family serine peptidase [Acidobacteriota bacterium]
MNYTFPTYEEAEKTSDVARYCTKSEYETAVRDRRFEFQKIKYLSDRLKITAYVYRPQKLTEQKLPTIIFNRGSFIRRDIAAELIVSFHRLAREGFAIIAPLYRQSDGGEGKDEMGGADMNDLMNTAQLAKQLNFVDTENLFMYGESRGGMMTYQALRNRFPLKAAAVFGAFTDMEAFLTASPNSSAVAKQIWPDFEQKKPEIFYQRSAIRWADKIDTPVLIMHGGADSLVSPLQSLLMAEQLQKLGKPYELMIYAGDNHILSNNRIERDQRVSNWFKKYLSN